MVTVRSGRARVAGARGRGPRAVHRAPARRHDQRQRDRGGAGRAGVPRRERHRRASSTASSPTGRASSPGWTARGRAATLTMMGHLDVVPADAGEWSVPPFAGVVKDGFVWGVGATDMKNQVAAEAVALARLKRSGAAVRRHRQVRRHGRRGGRRVLRRAVALRAPPGRAARRLPPQRGHGRPLAAGGRPQGVPARRRREGVRAVPHPHPRPRRPRVGAREGAQRRDRPGARRHGARPRRPAGDRLGHDGALHRRARARRASSPRASRTRPRRAPPAPSCAGSTRSWPV